MELNVKIGDQNNNGKTDITVRFVVMSYTVVDETFDADASSIQQLTGMVFALGRRLVGMVKP